MITIPFKGFNNIIRSFTLVSEVFVFVFFFVFISSPEFANRLSLTRKQSLEIRGGHASRFSYVEKLM